MNIGELDGTNCVLLRDQRKIPGLGIAQNSFISRRTSPQEVIVSGTAWAKALHCAKNVPHKHETHSLTQTEGNGMVPAPVRSFSRRLSVSHMTQKTKYAAEASRVSSHT